MVGRQAGGDEADRLGTVRRGGEDVTMEVLSGNVAVNANTGAIDLNASDKAIVLRNPESGRVEMVSAKELLTYGPWVEPYQEGTVDIAEGNNVGDYNNT
ncbi:MAG: hypothetical protein LIP05_11105, partial [Tannerellaceae bacterium]|nr:hypothetical protein [Tannerellaceae bacterium]